MKTYIKKNFKVDRIKTFEKFAFSSTEKEENKNILPILNEMRQPRECKGTMNVVDLWGRKLQRECLNETGLNNSKRKVQAYVYKKTKNNEQTAKEEKPVLLNRKNELILKNKMIWKKNSQNFLLNLTNLKK